jgi:asparagine N-glycosylation enzyme membrane subunit Stt3
MTGGAHVSAGETSGKAIASLVLGIGGFVIFPLVLSILAIVFGRQAKREIRERPGLGGAGLATAGIVLGWVGVALIVVAVLLFLLLVVASTSTG